MWCSRSADRRDREGQVRMTDIGAPRTSSEGIDPYCPYYAAAMDLVGRRWAGAVLRA